MTDNKQQEPHTDGQQPTAQTDRRTASQESQGQKPRPCPKDCSRCSLQQQVFCSASMMFRSFDVMNAVIQRLDRQQQTIDTLSQRLAAIQSSEAEFSAPQPVEQDLFAEPAK